MKKTIPLSLIIGILWMFASSAHASAPEWHMDKTHSGIYFNVKHIYSIVNGFFKDFDGKIEFDPENLDESRCEFTVKVKSIHTNDSKRDNHLLSGDFFDVDTYPVMTFKSDIIKHTGDDKYMVEGTLTIKDVSRKVGIPFIYFGSKTNPFNPKQLVGGFETRINLDRLTYHVGSGKFHEMGVVGKEVTIVISIEAIRDM